MTWCGAGGRADGELGTPAGVAGQQKIGQVGAGDQQEKPAGRKRGKQRGAGAGTGLMIGKWCQRWSVVSGIHLGVVVTNLALRGVELRSCCQERNARP